MQKYLNLNKGNTKNQNNAIKISFFENSQISYIL